MNKMELKIGEIYNNFGKSNSARTGVDQHPIDQKYFARMDTILDNNLKRLMIIKPTEGNGPCLSNTEVGQTVRKGINAPTMKFMFENCMPLGINEISGDYSITVDYGPLASEWFSVNKEKGPFDFETPVVVSITYNSTDLDIGVYEGVVTITTPRGISKVDIKLGIWY